MKYPIFSVSYKGDTNDKLRAYMGHCGENYSFKYRMHFMPTMTLGELRDLMRMAKPKSIIACNFQGVVE